MFQKQQQQNTLLRLRPSMRNYSLGVFILWENYKQRRVDHGQETDDSTFSQAGCWLARARVKQWHRRPRLIPDYLGCCNSLRKGDLYDLKQHTPFGGPMTNHQELNKTACELADSIIKTFKNILSGARTKFLFHWLGGASYRKKEIFT